MEATQSPDALEPARRAELDAEAETLARALAALARDLELEDEPALFEATLERLGDEAERGA